MTEVTPSAVAEVSQSIGSRLEQFGDLLAAMPDAGNRLTLGECGFPITFAWIDALAPLLALSIRWPETVVSYRRRVEALDAVALELVRYRETLRAFLER